MSRPKPGLNAEDLFTKGPEGISGDLRTLCPSLLALGLDHLGSGSEWPGKKFVRAEEEKDQGYKQGLITQTKKLRE